MFNFYSGAIFPNVSEQVKQTLNEFSPTAFKYVSDVVAGVTVKIGLYLLVFFMIFEFSSMFEKANMNNNGTIEANTALQATIRALLAGALVAGSFLIFQFILLIAIGGVNLLVNLGGGNAPTFPQSPSFTGNIGDIFINAGKFFGELISWLLLDIASIAAYVVVMGIIIIRFVEMYVLAALAPIPMASLASKQYASIGIGYIKNFAGYAFQGLVLMIIMGIYFSLQSVFSNPSAPWGDNSNPLTGLILPCVFLYAIFKSLSISKKLFGVGW